MAESDGVAAVTETSPVDQSEVIALPKTEEDAAPVSVSADDVKEEKEIEEKIEVEKNEDETEVTAVKSEEAAVEDQDLKRKELEGSRDENGADAKRQKVDLEEANELDKTEEQEDQAPSMDNGKHNTEEDLEQAGEQDESKSNEQDFQNDEIAPNESEYTDPDETTSRMIEVPTKRVGILIGKAGDTIRNLQSSSGAKIQIVKDSDADPNSTTREVELVGTIASINKAERLIKDVLAEAEAGGTPSLAARGFGTGNSGSEQVEIQIPNEKVGVVIGKGGQMIKDLQARSGARIQLVPQQASEGEDAKERTVRINGNRQQIDAAKSMIKDVISQSGRPQSHHRSNGSGNRQNNHGSRGPSSGNQWGQSRSQKNHNNNYSQHHRSGNNYRSAPQNYNQNPQQNYSNYPPPRGGNGHSMGGPTWDQRGAPPMGGPGPYAHQQVPPPQGYGHTNSYQVPPQQMYPAAAPPPQQFYGGQQSQPGYQSGYQQQLYNNTMYPQGPASGAPAQQYPYGPGAQSYGPQTGGSDGYSQQYHQQYPQQTGQVGQAGPGYGQAGYTAPTYNQPMGGGGGMNWTADQSAGYNNINQAMGGGTGQMGYGQAGHIGQLAAGGYVPQQGMNVNQSGFDQGAMIQPAGVVTPAVQGQVQPGGVQPVAGQWQG